MSAADAFLKDIIKVCKKHKLSIAHEDGHGSFIIEGYSQSNIEWLKAASVYIKRTRGKV